MGKLEEMWDSKFYNKDKSNDKGKRGVIFQAPHGEELTEKEFLKKFGYIAESSGLVMLLFNALSVREKNRFISEFKRKEIIGN